MKRYLVENAGYIHTILFMTWMLVAMAAFAVGTALFEEVLWMPIIGLSALIIQLAFAIVETDWVNSISEKSGYGRD